ncbi:MAG: hypothetical protein RLZZ08_409 [Pseudomonadota bacterium]|jgi:outer membrane protein assembly factor BamE (lipoprotein component of BamABCDE complex)
MAGMVRIGAILGAALVTTGLASGCTSIVSHRGFIADESLVAAVQPGLDNRQSVEATLGRPSLTSEYGDKVWYYISTTTGQKPFTTPRATQQTVLAVHFDAAGKVTAAERLGVDQVAYLHPNGSETPTLGRERSFLQDLFGNIGQVGAAGAGGAGGDNGAGGGQ